MAASIYEALALFPHSWSNKQIRPSGAMLAGTVLAILLGGQAIPEVGK
jgi:hypothetical protein